MSLSVALIWAMTNNRVIGRGNDLPWRLPKDMQHFMRTTIGHPVIMGRRTFESMPVPLPRRTNIVVTRNRTYAPAGARVAPDFETALGIAAEQCRRDGTDTVYVIGGAEIFRRALEVATRLHVTVIDAEIAGDTFFPDIDWSTWRRVSRDEFPADAEHAWPFSIAVWERALDPKPRL